MVTSSPPRASALRSLAGGRVVSALRTRRQQRDLQRSQVERLTALEARVRSLDERVADVAGSVDRLSETMVRADPELTRRVVESVQRDVGDLVVEIATLVAPERDRQG